MARTARHAGAERGVGVPGSDGGGVRGRRPRLEDRDEMSTIAKKVKELRPPKFRVRLRNRCRLCGRPRGYLRKFALCRLCFRKLALEGEITGVTKSSW